MSSRLVTEERGSVPKLFQLVLGLLSSDFRFRLPISLFVSISVDPRNGDSRDQTGRGKCKTRTKPSRILWFLRVYEDVATDNATDVGHGQHESNADSSSRGTCKVVDCPCTDSGSNRVDASCCHEDGKVAHSNMVLDIAGVDQLKDVYNSIGTNFARR